MLNLEEIKHDIATYERRIANPAGLSEQQVNIYRKALAAAQEQLSLHNQQNAKPPAAPAPTPPVQIQRTATPAPNSAPAQQQVSIRRPGGAEPTLAPISAEIKLSADHTPENPTIQITWSDGYALTLDETGACNRFKTLLRDLSNYKCVKTGRMHLIWKWDQSWRAVGVYKALAHFFGEPPNLQQVGVRWPTDTAVAVFNMILNKVNEQQPAT